jgi:hypothetical protein
MDELSDQILVQMRHIWYRSPPISRLLFGDDRPSFEEEGARRDRKMHLLAYVETGPTAQLAGTWRQPEADLDDIFKPERYEHMARTLEAARFDGCFLADTLDLPDIYKGSFDARRCAAAPTGRFLLSPTRSAGTLSWINAAAEESMMMMLHDP